MTTYFDGLEVPRVQTDMRFGATNASGRISFPALTYVPSSMEEIAVSLWAVMDAENAGIGWRPKTLVGKVLTIAVFSQFYDKSNTPTGTTDAAGGGAVGEPHSHTIGYTSTRVTPTFLPGVAIRAILIYPVARGA